MSNQKRNIEIYKKHQQGVKTGVLIKTYSLSRQRLHQIFKQQPIKEEKIKEEINKIVETKLCGTCLFYHSNGFCNHSDSLDDCADRDSNRICDIGQYKYNETKNIA